MFCVYVNGSGYVEKRNGTVFFHDDPRLASHYYDKDDAESGKIGHHRDMGGSGFKGKIVSLESSIRSYDACANHI